MSSIKNGAADGNRTREPLPYQGSALPTELQRHPKLFLELDQSLVHSCLYRHNSFKTKILQNRQERALEAKNGAGEGNRTLVISLEGWSFTTKLHPLKLPRIHLKQNFLNSALTITGSPPAENKYGGQEWIRTTEGVCRRSYSPFPLATRAPALTPAIAPQDRENIPYFLEDKPESGQPFHELAVGIEPTTPGLQNRNSTVELR